MNEPTPTCPVCGAILTNDHAACCPRCAEAGQAANTTEILPATVLGETRPDPAPESDAERTDGRRMPSVPGVRLLSYLNKGGMGVVWLGEQEATGRKVAVKFIRSGVNWADAMARARFEREIELAARLDHPNIGRVFDGGETDGDPYCVMEFIDGKPVNAFAAARKLDRGGRLELLRKICDAVEHAHRRGVLHRDLKPSNILVTPEGEPKLLDFGLARATDTKDMTLTAEGALAGTPAYMSPEQARGDTRAIDTRSDIYSLGVIGYELLVGRMPYPVDGSVESVLLTVAKCTVARPRAVDRSISPELEMLLLKALSREPGDRYETAGQMAEDIRRYLHHQPLIAGKTSTLYFVRKWLVRHWVAAGAACLALGGAGAALVYHVRSLNHEKQAALAAEEKSRTALHRSLSASIAENMQRGAFSSALQLIEEALRAEHPDRDDLQFQRLEALEGLNDPKLPGLIAKLDPLALRPEQRPRLDFWKADRLLMDGDASKGLALMQEAIKQGLPPLEDAMARAASSTTVAEAIRHYETAVGLAPWRPTAQRNLALGLLLSGRVPEARTQLAICRTLFPQDSGPHFMEAILEAFQGNIEASRAAANRIPEASGGARTLLSSAVVPLAHVSGDVVRVMRGAPTVTPLAEQMNLQMTIAKIMRQSKGSRPALAGFSGTPPILASGINGFVLALQAVKSNQKAAAAHARDALKACDEGALWGILASIEISQDNYDAALIAARNAQKSPSIMPGVQLSARYMEGGCLAMTWIKSRDAELLAQSAKAFTDVYASDARPPDLLHELPSAIAFASRDLFLARLIADAMPKDSPAQLSILVQIAWADGSRARAQEIADKAVSLFPDSASFKELAAKVRDGTITVPGWPEEKK